MIPKDIWKHHIAKYLSPIDVSRLRAASRFYRQYIVDTATQYRNEFRINGLGVYIVQSMGVIVTF